jgi:hypothetical protein
MHYKNDLLKDDSYIKDESKEILKEFITEWNW